MSDTDNRKTHLNVGGPRGWTTACGIESSSFVDLHKPEEHVDIDCKRCLRAMKRVADVMQLKRPL
jgi:hypothetical protein